MARPSRRSLWSEWMKRMNFTATAGRPAGGDLGQRARGAPGGVGGLVGRSAVGGPVAVLGVVEALERAGPVGKLRAAAEALLAEEALVEGVVEVLDRARLSRRHEHRRDTLVDQHAHDLPDPGRCDERAAVVELRPSR